MCYAVPVCLEGYGRRRVKNPRGTCRPEYRLLYLFDVARARASDSLGFGAADLGPTEDPPYETNS